MHHLAVPYSSEGRDVDWVGKVTPFIADGKFGTALPDRVVRKSAPIINVTTRTLEEILDSACAPHTIEFLSLDVEGFEWNVLRDFAWDKYKFLVLCIEGPPLQLHELLRQNGYVGPIQLGFDLWYFHPSFLAEPHANWPKRLRPVLDPSCCKAPKKMKYI
mmetsp:Transcript_41062/g.73549  ORF Transcript_41062/g.73549 Transcript_41062/m.73549 type:complete len:160 (-) Transcript_41062:106-585(-)